MTKLNQNIEEISRSILIQYQSITTHDKLTAAAIIMIKFKFFFTNSNDNKN